MGPLIRSASLRGFHDVVHDAGGDPDALLVRHGIDPAWLLEEDRLISQTDLDTMLDAAAEELRVPDLGLRLAEAQDISILGPLAVAIATATGAAEALDNASNFLFVHSPALRLRLEPDPQGRRGVVAVTYAKDTALSPYSPQGTELGLGLLFRIVRSLVGHDPSARSVHLPHRPLSPTRRYTEFFETQAVLFGARSAALCGSREILDRTFNGANPLIHAAAVEHLRQSFSDPGHDVLHRVRRTIAATLPSGTATVAATARLLALHPRTLQRQLRDRDVTFSQLMDEARRTAAHRYLTTTDLPLGQIASLVGYSEQSTLTHAVHRWFGTSPRRVRQEHR